MKCKDGSSDDRHAAAQHAPCLSFRAENTAIERVRQTTGRKNCDSWAICFSLRPNKPNRRTIPTEENPFLSLIFEVSHGKVTRQITVPLNSSSQSIALRQLARLRTRHKLGELI
ncbi:hypothetical protein VTI28DRAFT_1900 [Corynascus sepedonium]